ncbi:MAG TPA: ABC transporter permease [Sphingomonadaceae bacterium]|nr:ABC transporter permease [Sphingomonadaceae bacterium]
MATLYAELEETDVMEAGAGVTEDNSPRPVAEQAASRGRSAAFARMAEIAQGLIWPLIGIVAFLGLWAGLAPQVQTSLGSLPGPVEVAAQGVSLYEEWSAAKAAESEFYAGQDARNAAALAAGNPGAVQEFEYAGPPTFPGQVLTSLETVALGFLLATLVAVPVGLVCGLSKRVNAAINPLVQIMKPVSPLAWLPIVTMVISAMITSPDPVLPKAFVISALVVMLCSLWPTLINTAIGTASIDKDLLNVGRVLRLGWFARLTRLILPSALPYIFTGMRLSLGVGWMVLIAAEMLAQNPGLGKFVWDEFQNGSSQSLARIMFAVIVIGFIGFGLDRAMMALQSFANRNHTV